MTVTGVGDVCEDEAVDVEAAWSHQERTGGAAFWSVPGTAALQGMCHLCERNTDVAGVATREPASRWSSRLAWSW